MSVSHLKQIREALTRRGWRIVERVRGDENVPGSATWEIQRSNAGPIFLIDFSGFGPMGEDIPLGEAYGCSIRGRHASLYFRRVNRSRELWLRELNEFVAALDEPDAAGD